MEEKTNDSNSSTLSTASSEESGWSLYIEDFLASSKRAAAAAASATSGTSTTSSCVMLKRKREARGEGELHDGDDPLEDTATSHKVTRNEDATRCMELRKDRGAEVGFVKRVAECNELRKRGLCLVPVSMFLDYLG